MDNNIITAIKNIIESTQNYKLHSYYFGRNRANSMGEALENYIKDMFAGTNNETDENKRLIKFEQVFSYMGNQNNPPDIIIRNSDAIEVKKIESPLSSLALNSSYPKSKLLSNSPMITAACRNCENWIEKDIIYAIGVVKNLNLKKLFFIYGNDIAASPQIYERIKKVISSGVKKIPEIEFAETKELGRVNRVDPLGITYLRIRGMWGLENPTKVFSYVYTPSQNAKFEFTAIINTQKYNTFSLKDRNKLENLSNKGLSINNIKIKTPDNPSILRDAKLINYQRR